MIDKDTAAAAPGRSRLSAEKIAELKELAHTRGLEIQKRLRERDPFNDPVFLRAKQASRSIEKQINLSFSDARAHEDEEPVRSQTHTESVSAPWSCSKCSCKEALRVVHAGGWSWACDTCGNSLSDDEAENAVKRKKFSKRAALPPPARSRAVKVFDHDQLLTVVENKDSMTSDAGDRRRIEVTLLKLIELDEERPLALPNPAYEAQIEELAHAFPAFSRVLYEVVGPSLSVLAAGGVVRQPPVLLVGAPGIGKTYFLTLLARVLGVPLIKQDMSSATTGCSLSGLGPHWGNSSPGSVFRTLAFGKPGRPAVANPLFMLDELDKCSGDRRFDPIGPLHALLEEESAHEFEDESLPGIVFNASEIRWVATANSVHGIPSPILSRMHVIEIEEPTRAEKIALAERIFADVVRSMRLREFVDVMPDAVLERAADLAPREFKRLAQMAVGNALSRGDFQPRPQHFEIRASAQKRKMGF